MHLRYGSCFEVLSLSLRIVVSIHFCEFWTQRPLLKAGMPGIFLMPLTFTKSEDPWLHIGNLD